MGSREWMIGYITYIDFYLYEVLELLLELSPNCLDRFQNLKKIGPRIRSLPQIGMYLNTTAYIERPFLIQNVI